MEYTITREGRNATLAYEGKRVLYKVGSEHDFDGTRYVVLSSAPSEYVPTVMLVKLKEI